MFALKRKRKTLIDTAEMLYFSALKSARDPVFYKEYGVPDTVDGRFEMITLHVFILMSVLDKFGYQGKVLKQPLFDVMFRDIEYAGREMGIGDLSIPKQMKRMMEGFNGRVFSYNKALNQDENALLKALEKNIYGTVTPPKKVIIMALSQYLKNNIKALKSNEILEGQAAFIKIDSFDG
jgi:cytochrome b pre-mRNA-processing protein 3